MLTELIDDYGSQNDKLKALKKTCDDQNTKIKAAMNELITPDEDGTRKAESDDYIAVLSVRDNSVMNEEKLITWLKKKGLNKGIVKKKDYVDSEALENAIYNHLISEDDVIEMECCKEYKTTSVLNVKKKKKGE